MIHNMAEIKDLILVTGASGFIGTQIIKQLLQEGYSVRGTVRSLKEERKIKPIYELFPNGNDRLELTECELLDKDCWKEAVKGCKYVLHVASPVMTKDPEDENECIKPAVDGTLNVLQACREARTVRRVVLTRSTAAIMRSSGNINRPFSEIDWTDTEKVSSFVYIKSKTLAEKAAWDFVDSLDEEEKFELSVINPSYVLGPILCGTSASSMLIPTRLLTRDIPVLPELYFGICDVRDVAKAHIKAMTVPEAAGHRHIICNGIMSVREIALVIEREFKPQGYNIPTIQAPKFIFRMVSLFDSEIKMILDEIGKKIELDTSRMRNILKIEPIPNEDAIKEMCYCLIESGRVPKSPSFQGRPQR